LLQKICVKTTVHGEKLIKFFVSFQDICNIHSATVFVNQIMCHKTGIIGVKWRFFRLWSWFRHVERHVEASGVACWRRGFHL